MFTVRIAPRAERQIVKLDETTRQAVRNYLKEKIMTADGKNGLYDAGGIELAGNLRGLWRFKSPAFRKLRIIGYLEDAEFIITVLVVESRASSYKNKEDLAKKARKGLFDRD